MVSVYAGNTLVTGGRAECVYCITPIQSENTLQHKPFDVGLPKQQHMQSLIVLLLFVAVQNTQVLLSLLQPCFFSLPLSRPPTHPSSFQFSL